MKKIYQRPELKKIIARLKKEGKTVGFTNGVFDILHVGHVDYLSKAKKKCDILVVSINTDASAKLYKDPGRPINSQDDRARVVAALEGVDYVTFHNERRMREALIAFKPHYYIKAGDYKLSDLTSRDVLKKWGGLAIIVPPLKGKSTTNILQKIVNIYKVPISLESDVKKRGK